MIEITDWARDILRRADLAARRLNPEARVRLARAPGGLVSQLTDAPEPGDATLDVDGAEILIAGDLQGLVDIEEPHDRLVLRPLGSEPNPREH